MLSGVWKGGPSKRGVQRPLKGGSATRGLGVWDVWCSWGVAPPRHNLVSRRIWQHSLANLFLSHNLPLVNLPLVTSLLVRLYHTISLIRTLPGGGALCQQVRLSAPPGEHVGLQAIPPVKLWGANPRAQMGVGGWTGGRIGGQVWGVIPPGLPPGRLAGPFPDPARSCCFGRGPKPELPRI